MLLRKNLFENIYQKKLCEVFKPSAQMKFNQIAIFNLRMFLNFKKIREIFNNLINSESKKISKIGGEIEIYKSYFKDKEATGI